METDMADPFRIVFILYPRLTQLDFTGPYEVLARMPGAEAIIASKDGGTLVTELGLTFTNLRALADIENADMIMIPGGPGQTDAMQDPEFMAEVKRLGEGADYVTSVCTGSLILAAAGLLTGCRRRRTGVGRSTAPAGHREGHRVTRNHPTDRGNAVPRGRLPLPPRCHRRRVGVRTGDRGGGHRHRRSRSGPD